ncbi:AMP-dependent synthetase/ligase [Reichenbachiella versicolor]|uniref:AMP-dependent synthetase/ligase n=1 Tax=Reichenbachiella versicolor TaxID=1821036 RepID=UPI000D6E0E79|nr:AMP-dependent synthetase/ligase [Reichenbachiella versicolor]
MKATRTFDFAYNQLHSFPLKECLNHKVNGEWVSYSTQEVINISQRLSLGFLKLGLKPGDKVALISDNRPEWNFVDLACQQLGIVTVPLYPTINVKDYKYIFEHARVKAIFAGTRDLIEKVLESTIEIPVDLIYSFDKLDGIAHWREVAELDATSDLEIVEDYKDIIRPDDLLTIIYTSGTTGFPKGVMLTHSNLTTNVNALITLAGHMLIDGKDRALSFLPMCHIFERVTGYFYFQKGVSVYYAESMETIGDNLREIKPQMFTCVPRLLEKVYDKIVAKGHELKGIKRKLFFWALRLGHRYDPNINLGWWYNVQLKIARKLIFSKWQEALGGNIQLIPSGAAALQPRLARIFWAAGIKIFEGYGLTETSPAITLNHPDDIRIGCVGKPIPEVEVKIADDGEILCKGPNVMKGYYKNDELTKEVLQDGWFHTGDIGIMEDGFVRITDRKKEMFKTSGGKYIAPQMMENKFKESEFIEQIMVLGEGQKFPSALIVPNFEILEEWCDENKVDSKNIEELVKNPRIQDLYQIEVRRFNKEFGQWEQIKKFELIDKSWGIDTGELTPTLKLKRRIIKEKFKELIKSIYDLAQ